MNPFPGLRPFDFADRDVFFGRESQVAALIGHLRRKRFTAVMGSSGCGKSSLVRAGLLPALCSDFMAGLEFPSDGRSRTLRSQPRGARWRLSVLRPGAQPLAALASAVQEGLGAQPDRVADEREIDTILREIRSKRSGLTDVIGRSAIGQDENLLIVVDQFEEIFRNFGERGSARWDEASCFVGALLEAAFSTTIPIYVLLTMRSDFLGDCAAFVGLPEMINDGMFLVPGFTRDQLRDAIERPVAVSKAAIEQSAVERILNDQGQSSYDQMPLFAHALKLMWDIYDESREPDEVIGVEHYLRTGGVGVSISRGGDEILNSLPEHMHAVAERVFRAVTGQDAENRAVRRAVIFAQLCSEVGMTLSDVVHVLDRFRADDCGFVLPSYAMAPSISESTIIDLSHEAVIRQWDRIQPWLNKEAQSARYFQFLKEVASGGSLAFGVPALAEEAARWRQEQLPTHAWADRYGGGLDTVLELIARSVAARDTALMKDRGWLARFRR